MNYALFVFMLLLFFRSEILNKVKYNIDSSLELV